MKKVLCVLVLALTVPVGVIGGNALAHVISQGETTYHVENGGFGIFCAKYYQDLSHGASGWTAGGWTHSVYGVYCPCQDLNLSEGDLVVTVEVQRADSSFCSEFTDDANPNLFGVYSYASASLNNFCGAPASGSKRVRTSHVSRLYGNVSSIVVNSPWHSTI